METYPSGEGVYTLVADGPEAFQSAAQKARSDALRGFSISSQAEKGRI